MGTILATASPKGGVGKTTITQSVSSAYAMRGLRVLAVDLDQQGALAETLNADPEPGCTIAAVLRGSCTASDAVVCAPIAELPSLDVLPGAHDELAAVELELSANPLRSLVALRTALADLDGSYDVVVIDTPPSTGFLTANAVLAADGVVGVLTPEALPYLEAANLPHFVRELGAAHTGAGRYLGTLINRMTSSAQARDVASLASEELHAFPTRIPQSEWISRAVWDRKPVLVAHPRRPGSRAFFDAAADIAAAAGFHLPDEPVSVPA